MSVTVPSDPREIQEFQFKLACRLRVFDEKDEEYKDSFSLVAPASKYGFVFVGCGKKVQAILLSRILELEHPPEQKSSRGASHGGTEIRNYLRRELLLPDIVTNLHVNCDQSLLVVAVTKGGCAHAFIYDIASFCEKTINLVTEIRLATGSDAQLLDLAWNPGIPNILASCLSNGTVVLYEIKNGRIDINSLPPEAQATCFSWSPKGKQLVVGSLNGTLTQYKPDLKAVKNITPPAIFDRPAAVVNVLWISNYQFAAVYRDSVNESERPSLLIVNAPKSGDVTFVNYEDICYSSGDLRKPQFYLLHQQNWNVLVVGSANSMEVGVLGLTGDQLTWEQWLQEDASRAELPLTSSKEETFPLGVGLDTCTQKQLLWGENQFLPPMPILILLSHRGVLCLFYMINTLPQAPVVCSPPEKHPDESMLVYFTTSSGNDESGSIPQENLTSQQVTDNTPLSSKPIEWATPSGVVDVNRMGLRINLTEKFENIAPSQVQNAAKPVFSLGESSKLSTDPSAMTNLANPATGSLNFNSKPSAVQGMGSLFSGLSTLPSSENNSPLATQGSSKLNFSIPTATSTPNMLQQQTQQLQFAQIQQQLVSNSNHFTNEITEKSRVTPTNSGSNLNDGEIEKQGKEIINSKVLYVAVEEEMKHFENELAGLKIRLGKLNTEVGTADEKTKLRKRVDAMDNFCRELQETTTAQCSEVQALKAEMVESLAWAEDAKSRAVQQNDPCWLQVIRSQELDPGSAQNLANMKQLSYYVESQLCQADRSLDLQWANFQDSCRDKIKGRLYIPSLEAVYQAMVLQSNILLKQKSKVKNIMEKTTKHKITKGGSLSVLRTNIANVQSKSNSDLAALAENLLQMRLEAANSSGVAEDISEIIAAGRYSMVASMNNKLTPEKQATLREFLTQRPVQRIRPTKPSLKNLSMLEKHAKPHEVTALKHPATETNPLGYLDNAVARMSSESLNGLKSPYFNSVHKETIGMNMSVPAKGNARTMSLTTTGEDHSEDLFGHIAKSVVTKFKEPDTAPSVPVTVNSLREDNLKSQGLQSPITFNSNVQATNNQNVAFSFSSSVPAPLAKSKGTINFNSNSSSNQSATQIGEVFAKSNNETSFTFKVPKTVAANFASNPSMTTNPSSTAIFSGTTSKPSSFNFFLASSAPTTSASVQFFGSVTNETLNTSGNAPTTLTTTSKIFPLDSQSINTTTPTPTSSVPSIFGGKPNITQTSFPGITTSQPKTSQTTSFFSGLGLNNSATDFSFSISSTPLSNPSTSGTAKSIFGGTSAKSVVETAIPDLSSQSTVNKSMIPTFGVIVSGSTLETGTPSTVNTQPSSTASVFSLGSKSNPETSDFNFGQLNTALSITPVAAVQETLNEASTSEKSEQLVASTTISNPSAPVSITTNTVSSVPTKPFTFSLSAISPPSNVAVTKTSVAVEDEKNKLPVTPASVSFFGQPVCSPSLSSNASNIFEQKTPASIFGGGGNTNVSSSSVSEGKTANGAAGTARTLAAAVPTSADSAVNAASSVSSTSLFGGSALALSLPNTETPVTTSGVAAVIVTTITTSATISATTTAATSVDTNATTSSTTTSSSSSLFGNAVSSSPLFGIATTTPGSIFGGAPTTSASAFGSGSSFFDQTSTVSNSSLFKPQSTTSVTPVFGQATTATATTAGSIFGQTSNTSIFGQAATTTTSSSIFGQPSTSTAASVFGQQPSTTTGSLFGQQVSTTTSSVFGQPTSTASVFGPQAATTSGSIFGQSVTTTATLAFGQPAVTTSTSTFGSNSTGTSIFGQPTSTTSTNIFGQPATSATSAFGGTSNTFGQSSGPFLGGGTQPAFGSSPNFGQSGGSIFGQNTGPGFGSTGGSIFGETSTFGKTGNLFQSPSGGSIFGGSSGSGSTSGGAFSAPVGQSIAESGFGSPSAFGQQNKQGGFGSPPAFGQTSSGGGSSFGGSPTFGGAPTFGGSPVFGSTNRVFGTPASPPSGSVFGGGGTQQQSNTFENLATQNTMTFGNLASGQSPTFGSSGVSLFGGAGTSQPQPSAFQNTPSFGGSSFSSWR